MLKLEYGSFTERIVTALYISLFDQRFYVHVYLAKIWMNSFKFSEWIFRRWNTIYPYNDRVAV